MHLGEKYGRPIEILTAELPEGSPDGALLCSAQGDFILVEERLTPIHKRQVILHELGHLVCGHLPEGKPGETVSRLLPSLNPALVERVLSRAHRDSEAEREAEYVGSLIGQTISSWELCPSYATPPPELEALVGRLSALESGLAQRK
ncbi:ImmA/IrrE family metallo-endopeptidase [Streptomyces sp. NPDC020412]|uniref:ImmA/IrrE family metallo-endopeptidase n=1 Tax=Streptomyces sp. NPDC020412 TaxID=3365073 RepID=UPI0037ACB4B1